MPGNHRYHREETKKVVDIFNGIDQKYRYIRLHLKFSSCEGDPLLAQYRRDINRVHLALRAINPILSYIITQTFRTDGQINNRWWRGIYSKSTFYRIRFEAIETFLKEYEALC